MKKTDCRKCCVSDFKDALCDKEFCEKYYREGSAEDFEKLLPHWIPCSERMPEDYEEVLVWFEYFRYGDYNRPYQTHGIGDYSSKYDSWMINHESGWSKLRVLAWMPLPEPYAERREE